MSECPHYSLRSLPETERPRERLMHHGAESVSSAELIAIILGSGMKGKSVLQLAHELMMHFGSLKSLAEATVQELCQIKGLGSVKALQLKAAVTLGLRTSKQTQGPRQRISHPMHAYNMLKDMFEGEKREHFAVILQDIKGYVITCELVSIGTLSCTLVHPREVFYPAIRHKAAAMILAHNHPSGDPTPSKQDVDLTESLIEAGKLVGIPVQDHIILGNQCYVSLRERGVSFERTLT